MSRDNHTTLTAVTAPMVLTIGCPSELQGRVEVALGLVKTILKHCELAQAPTLAAQKRPLVMVIPEDLYEFDPQEFDALARDVGASLLRVEEDIDEVTLEMLLSAGCDAAMARRKKQGAQMVDIDDPRLGPPSRRKTAPLVRRTSFADRAHPASGVDPAAGPRANVDAPPSSHGAPRA